MGQKLTTNKYKIPKGEEGNEKKNIKKTLKNSISKFLWIYKHNRKRWFWESMENNRKKDKKRICIKRNVKIKNNR